MINKYAAAIGSVVVTLALAWLGLTGYLGAHPVAWPVKVAVIGAPIGAIIALGAGFVIGSKVVRAVLFAVLLLGALGLAHYGKVQFAASFAEDQLAGKFWYFGWIATCAMTASLLATIAARQEN